MSGDGGVERYATGSAWEKVAGCSRMVAAGPLVFVSACSPIVDGDVQYESDPYLQTVAAFRIVEQALAQAGCSLADAVQTRLYVEHSRDREEIVRAHAALFGQVRPALTMIQVGGFVDQRVLVEVEVVAYRGGPA